MTITIPDTALKQGKLKKEIVLIDFAVFCYEKQIMSMGQARGLVKMDVVSFQKELSKRGVYIHFEIEDLEKDLRNLGMAV